MKADWTHLEIYRLRSGPRPSRSGDRFGVFQVRRDAATGLVILAVDGLDPDGDMPEIARWEHVSVHAVDLVTLCGELRERTPSWEEMCFVKNLFWEAEEAVAQLHPPASSYVNLHPHTLHLWRPLDVALPLPPVICV